MKMQNKKVVINAIMVKTKEGDLVPIKVVFLSYNGGKKPEIFDTIVNPERNIEEWNTPPYLTRDLVNIAPVANQIKETVKEMTNGKEIYGKNGEEVMRFFGLEIA